MRPVQPQAICLAGPTAAGKSAVAMGLAERLPLEIISVDSAQVYRRMDIGTAKPTAAERAAVPHHLIDILDPSERYSAARFAQQAHQLVTEIRARGRVPLLVGGTMLYLKALREGLDELPQADPEVRAVLEAEAAERGWPALHAELARVDPPTAARLAPADGQRIQRALEVWRLSGKALSAWHGHGADRSEEERAEERARRCAFWPVVSLEPDDRAFLHRRIAARCDEMFAAGLVDEVRALRADPGLGPDLPSMRCVGYRQVWAALERGGDPGLRTAVVTATRQLAKRQLTWLRAITERTVIACDREDAPKRATEVLMRIARNGLHSEHTYALPAG